MMKLSVLLLSIVLMFCLSSASSSDESLSVSESESIENGGGIGDELERLILDLLLNDDGSINEVAFQLFIDNFSMNLREALEDGVDDPFIIALRAAILETILMNGTPAPTSAAPTTSTMAPSTSTALPTTSAAPTTSAPTSQIITTPSPTIQTTQSPTSPTATPPAPPTIAMTTSSPTSAPSTLCSDSQVLATGFVRPDGLSLITNTVESPDRSDANFEDPVDETNRVLSAAQSLSNTEEAFLLTLNSETGVQTIYNFQIDDAVQATEESNTISVELVTTLEGDFEQISSITEDCNGGLIGFASNNKVLYELTPDNDGDAVTPRPIGAITGDISILSPITFNFDTGRVVQVINTANTSVLEEYTVNCPVTDVTSTVITPSNGCGDGDIAAVAYIGNGLFQISCNSEEGGGISGDPQIAVLDSNVSPAVVTTESASAATDLFPSSGGAPIGGLVPLSFDGEENCDIQDVADCPDIGDLLTCTVS